MEFDNLFHDRQPEPASRNFLARAVDPVNRLKIVPSSPVGMPGPVSETLAQALGRPSRSIQMRELTTAPEDEYLIALSRRFKKTLFSFSRSAATSTGSWMSTSISIFFFPAIGRSRWMHSSKSSSSRIPRFSDALRRVETRKDQEIVGKFRQPVHFGERRLHAFFEGRIVQPLGDVLQFRAHHGEGRSHLVRSVCYKLTLGGKGCFYAPDHPVERFSKQPHLIVRAGQLNSVMKVVR
jgi:hypothetical protein